MNKKGRKGYWRNLWKAFWKDDSFKGWVISIIFLFLLIKGIFFPVMELTTGTELPLVIVESCSMYHDGNIFSDYEEWWIRHEQKYDEFSINKVDFDDFIFKKGFNKGDILFIVGAKPEKLEVGDVIVFNANYRNPVIHRIMSIENTENGYLFSTIGDNNVGQLQIEKRIKEDQIIGKANSKIAPYLGWIKLIFFERLRDSSERGFCDEN